MDDEMTHRTATDFGPLQPVSCSLCGAKIILEPKRSDPYATRGACTHICHENHPTVGNEVEERFNLAMLFEEPSYVFATRLILRATEFQSAQRLMSARSYPQ